MVSTPTTRLRIERQGLGDNLNVWGETKLNDALERIDEAIGGVAAITISGTSTTLTSTNYATDQARKAALVFTGTLSANSTVTVPNVEKLYLVVNNTTQGAYSLTIKTAAGSGYALRGGPQWVYCDATDVYRATGRLDQLPAAGADVALGGYKVTGLGTPSAGTDAATKAYADAGDAAITAAVASSATAAAASATAASTSATAASTSATASATSATNSASSATAAASSASAASTSATNAANSATAAAASAASILGGPVTSVNGSTGVVTITAAGLGAATLTGSETLTNKTLTAPVIGSISNTGTVTLPTSTDTLVGRATTDTLTNKTLTSPVISSISNTGTLTLPTSTDTLVGRATTDTLTNKTLTAPTVNGGTAAALTSFGVRSTGAAFDLKLASAEAISANRTLSVTLGNADRTLSLGGNLTTAGAFTTSGAFAQTLTATGTTNVTLPTTGTLATLTGTETLTNKTLRLGAGSHDLAVYEEGNWTPTLAGNTTPGSHTYAVQVGRYVRIGNLVYASCTIQLSAKDGTMAGAVSIQGMPFTASSAVNHGYAATLSTVKNFTLTGTGTWMMGYMDYSAAKIFLEAGKSGASTTLIDSADVTSTSMVRMSITYRTG